MKVKSFRCPRGVTASVAEGRTLLRGFAAVARRNLRWLPPILLLTLALGLMAWHEDRALLAFIQQGNAYPGVNTVARFLSKWGDYQTYSVPLALVLWLYGVLRRERSWRRIALVCFLGASLAGLFNDCFRLTLGRPRPNAEKPDGFYGPRLTWYGDYQSFPSGHSATAFGTGVSLLVVDPPLGVVTTVYACGVAWARMDLNRHYPSDITVGTMVGIVFGLAVGYGAKRPNSKP